MSQLDTPLPPQGRSGKPSLFGAAGKDTKGRTGIGERAARGSAFSAVLQSANGKAPQAGAARAEKGADAVLAMDETGTINEASLAGEGAQPTASNAPAPPSSLDAATLLLLGTLQPPVAAREPSETRGKERDPKRDAAMAALGSALGDAGRKAARPAGPEMAASTDVTPSDMPGLAMPDDDTPIGAPPDADAMAMLSALVDDKPRATAAADADAASARPVSVTIVRQETYLPPVMRLSPFQQVVEPIRLAATEIGAARSQTAPDLDPSKPAEIAAPTKVLHLELRPVELGSLLVKMRLTQGGMEIRIEASSAETARMLANDKEALREVVRASGFSVDAVSIETVHVDGLSADRHGSGQEASRNDQPDHQGRGFDQSRQGEHQQEPRRRGWTPEASSKEDVHDPDQAGRSGRDAHRYL